MKILILILFILINSCKNDKKEDLDSIDLEVVNKLILPNHNLWIFNRLSFDENFSDKERLGAFKVTRTSLEETAYALVPETPIIYGSKYRISIEVKKGDLGYLFGLRVVSEYPNRIDAVFDLKSGCIVDNKSSGNFIEGKASIAQLNNGWYKCSIISELDSNMVRVIFGPTSGLGKAITWEASTKDFCDNYIIPSSLTIEELKIKL
ncbi:hypothetical protein L3X39_03025 [Sabulilitoribacter multivorans]|uniref:Uncharacterized protein n=1 Tax=Flaviramulus multivorans TaxID=1304750 RepID=A0ABS9IGP1_9FLAO|nr:hypothetical protein [Flaviramulus multivorans]MCF7559595.1 hypothetical protein [Flaviramulus multivorans]